jgi:CheY-like chemotaxis protein
MRAPPWPAPSGAPGGQVRVRAARDEDETLEAVRSFGADLLIASESTASTRAVWRALKARDPDFPIILVYAPEEGDPDGRALRAGAEACLQGPLKQGTVLSCVRNVLALPSSRGRPGWCVARPRCRRATRGSAAREDEPVTFPDRARGHPGGGLRSLPLAARPRVKRSRRYRYRVAFIVLPTTRSRPECPSWRPPTCRRCSPREDRAGPPSPGDGPGLRLPPGSGWCSSPYPAEGAVWCRAPPREAHRPRPTYLMASAGVSVHLPTEGGGDLSFGKLFRTRRTRSPRPGGRWRRTLMAGAARSPARDGGRTGCSSPDRRGEGRESAGARHQAQS